MSIKSTNKPQDRFLISCGAEDDKTIRVWDFVEKILVCEAVSRQDNFRATIYNLHLVCFENLVPETLETEQEIDEFSKGKLRDSSSDPNCGSGHQRHNYLHPQSEHTRTGTPPGLPTL